MKRVLIFLLLGPALGVLTVVLIGMLTEPGIPNAVSIGVMLPSIYLFGSGPALIAAAADWLSERFLGLAPLYRIIVTGIAGYLATALVLDALFGVQGTSFGFIYGLIAAPAAMICAYLSGKRMEEAAA